MLNLQDEALLNAYLDGELSPSERAAVEARLLVEPQLAERLRQLQTLTAKLAALPAVPTPRNFRAPVIATLQNRGWLRQPKPTFRWGWPLRAAFGLQAAFTVLLMLSIGLLLALTPAEPSTPTVGDMLNTLAERAAEDARTTINLLAVQTNTLAEQGRQVQRTIEASAPPPSLFGWLVCLGSMGILWLVGNALLIRRIYSPTRR